MWWSTKSEKRAREPSPQHQLQELRRRQIESITASVPQARASKPNEVYEITMRLGNASFNIIITLPPEFPNSAPVISVAPAVQHPWIDPKTMRFVSPEKLARWSPHTSLGSILSEIVREFSERAPLLLLSGTVTSSSATSTTSGGGSGQLPPWPGGFARSGPPPVPQRGATWYGAQQAGAGGYAQYQPQTQVPQSFDRGVSMGHLYGPQRGTAAVAAGERRQPGGISAASTLVEAVPQPQPQPVHTLLPPVPDHFPELEAMNAENLQNMLDDPLILDSFFNELQAVKTTRSLVADLDRSNEELAKANLLQEKEVDEMNGEIVKLQRIAAEKVASLRVKEAKRQEIVRRLSSDVLRERLAAAAEDAETEGEACADGFLEGHGDVNEFLQNYMALRRLYHFRMGKRETLPAVGQAH